MDALKVRIERHPDLSVETCEAAAVVLAQRIKVHVGSTVAVQLEEPGALPRSEGKYKRVYDLR
jgi:phenylacetate-CoA ligase